MLPQIEVPVEGEVTAPAVRRPPLHFEIGFGSGEHLADRADMLPDHGFIGAEPFLNGVATRSATSATSISPTSGCGAAMR
jgi:tRNA (guanine-N7-)-methyltransferase